MRVMLIDDHPLIVSAMQRILRELDLQTAVVTAGSAAAAREVLQADASFDLLLLDLALPDIDGHAFLGELRRTHPSLPVVVVSASERAADVVRAIDAGAMGFVTKRTTPQALLQALRAVLQGVIVVPDELSPEPLPEPDAVTARHDPFPRQLPEQPRLGCGDRRHPDRRRPCADQPKRPGRPQALRQSQAGGGRSTGPP